MARRKQKGNLGLPGLPLSKKYILPITRRRMMALGGIAILVVLAIMAVEFYFHRASLLSGGPLSFNHASLGSDCASCHTAFDKVADQSCNVCHEKFGDELGVYSFSSHYLYRSGDFERIKVTGKEEDCAACHPEHRGREGVLTEVPDRLCLDCHEFGSFNQEHPNFDALSQSDDETLKFTHIRHVREVMKHSELEDLEKACLYCHNPEIDGKGFKNIDFDRHCDSCHLTTSVTTPRLAIRSSEQPGVLTLAGIQNAHEPGSLWSFYANPNEFRQVGDRFVSKSPLHHRDPWVMENLRDLRRQLYTDGGLADLLNTSTNVPPRDLKRLYREAIETLRAYALELRSRPEPGIQSELNHIEKILRRIEHQVDDPFAPLDETEFLLALTTLNPHLGEDQVQELDGLVNDLSEPCRTCHLIDKATIARVNRGQTQLHRAEFDHRAHILQRRCLDCHARIPLRDFVGNSDPVDPEFDHAAIQNLPDIETCRECHNSETASNQCITCHQFHPDKNRGSHLLLYLD